MRIARIVACGVVGIALLLTLSLGRTTAKVNADDEDRRLVDAHPQDQAQTIVPMPCLSTHGAHTHSIHCCPDFQAAE